MLLPDCGMMFDAGTGIFRAPRYLKNGLLMIFLSHAHADHVIGLTYLLNIARLHRLDRVVVYGEPDKLAAINQHLFSELLFPKKPPMEMRPLERDVEVPQGGRLTHFRLEHPGGSIGFRVDWPDRSLAYVTDVTAAPGAEYVERIRGVNLLVHECYFPDTHADWARRTFHSWTTPVAQVARRAAVGRLVLVHLNPLGDARDPVGLETARSIFPRTELGHDLMEIDF